MPSNGCVYKPADKNAGGSSCFLLGDEGNCSNCKCKLTLIDPNLSKRWVDPLLVITSKRERTTALRGLLAGRSAFLICGGPSANLQSLERLYERGVWSMAVNNMAGHHRIRPQAFVCSDPPSKFCDSIWHDPGIMKFVPSPKLKGRRGNIRRKLNDGLFENSSKIQECPNVWGFQRWSWLSPDEEFFTTDGACWGNQNQGVQMTGEPKTVCTLLLGIRLLRYLGASQIFLVGVDFRMTPDYGYAFNQNRNLDAVMSNNTHFEIVGKWLCELQKRNVFQRFGLKLYNTFERSGLRAFPYVPFDEAIDLVKDGVQDNPDLSGWYEPRKKKK